MDWPIFDIIFHLLLLVLDACKVYSRFLIEWSSQAYKEYKEHTIFKHSWLQKGNNAWSSNSLKQFHNKQFSFILNETIQYWLWPLVILLSVVVDKLQRSLVQKDLRSHNFFYILILSLFVYIKLSLYFFHLVDWSVYAVFHLSLLLDTYRTLSRAVVVLSSQAYKGSCLLFKTSILIVNSCLKKGYDACSYEKIRQFHYKQFSFIFDDTIQYWLWPVVLLLLILINKFQRSLEHQDLRSHHDSFTSHPFAHQSQSSSNPQGEKLHPKHSESPPSHVDRRNLHHHPRREHECEQDLHSTEKDKDIVITPCQAPGDGDGLLATAQCGTGNESGVVVHVPPIEGGHVGVGTSRAACGHGLGQLDETALFEYAEGVGMHSGCDEGTFVDRADGDVDNGSKDDDTDDDGYDIDKGDDAEYDVDEVDEDEDGGQSLCNAVTWNEDSSCVEQEPWECDSTQDGVCAVLDDDEGDCGDGDGDALLDFVHAALAEMLYESIDDNDSHSSVDTEAEAVARLRQDASSLMMSSLSPGTQIESLAELGLEGDDKRELEVEWISPTVLTPTDSTDSYFSYSRGINSKIFSKTTFPKSIPLPHKNSTGKGYRYHSPPFFCGDASSHGLDGEDGVEHDSAHVHDLDPGDEDRSHPSTYDAGREVYETSRDHVSSFGRVGGVPSSGVLRQVSISPEPYNAFQSTDVLDSIIASVLRSSRPNHPLNLASPLLPDTASQPHPLPTRKHAPSASTLGAAGNSSRNVYTGEHPPTVRSKLQGVDSSKAVLSPLWDIGTAAVGLGSAVRNVTLLADEREGEGEGETTVPTSFPAASDALALGLSYTAVSLENSDTFCSTNSAAVPGYQTKPTNLTDSAVSSSSAIESVVVKTEGIPDEVRVRSISESVQIISSVLDEFESLYSTLASLSDPVEGTSEAALDVLTEDELSRRIKDLGWASNSDPDLCSYLDDSDTDFITRLNLSHSSSFCNSSCSVEDTVMNGTHIDLRSIPEDDDKYPLSYLVESLSSSTRNASPSASTKRRNLSVDSDVRDSPSSYASLTGQSACGKAIDGPESPEIGIGSGVLQRMRAYKRQRHHATAPPISSDWRESSQAIHTTSRSVDPHSHVS